MNARGYFYKVRTWATRPANGVFVISLILLAVSMALTYRHMAYNSDDVYWQKMLVQHWHPFGKDLFFGSDNELFIMQLPLYWVVSLFVAPGRHAMLVDGVLLACINFTLFYVSALYFLHIGNKKINTVTLLPIVWLSSFGYGLSRLFLGTNLHTLSVGLCFVVLMLTSKLCRGAFDAVSPKWRVVLLIGIPLGVALSIINDRYFLYFGVFPAAALAVLHFASKRITLRRLVFVFSIIVASGIAYELLAKLLLALGFVLAKYFGMPEFVNFDQLGSSVVKALHSTLAVSGTNFLGQGVTSVAAISALLDLALVFLVVWGSIMLLRNKRSGSEEKVFAGLFWFIIGALALSTWNLDLWSYRYLAALPFVAAITLIYHMSSLRLTVARVNAYKALVLAAVLLNLAVNMLGTATDRPSYTGEYTNTANLALIDTLERAGVRKGYAEYWSAHINTYLSDGRLNIEPTTCVRDGFTVPRLMFVSKTQFLAPSEQSFYIFDNFNEPTQCTQKQVQTQFGVPKQALTSGSYTIWIYDYDILTKSDTSWLAKDY